MSIHVEFVSTLVRSHRATMLAQYGSISADLKHDKSVVTEMDRLIESEIRQALTQRFPDHGMYGEEYGRTGSQSNYWLIDPIDGTENYVRGLPGITTIIGLVEDGKMKASYVYDIVADAVFHAERGRGAFRDQTLLSMMERPTDRAMLALTSSVSAELFSAVTHIKEATGLRHALAIHGCGYKSILLAKGQIDGIVVFNGGGSQWDYAPTTLLNQESGAVHVVLRDDGLDTNHFALLSSSIVSDIEPLLRKHAS